MTDEPLQDSPLVADATESASDPISEPAEAGEAHVAEFDILEDVPEAIDWIQFGSVTG
jgi:hypothetical protein